MEKLEGEFGVRKKKTVGFNVSIDSHENRQMAKIHNLDSFHSYTSFSVASHV
jgi:hypothetical protein